jgi:hypothetical protein
MRAPRMLSAGLLCLSATVLVACGGTGKGLIPAQDAGPLQGDFEAVAQAAQAGNGSCTTTATAIRKTEQDFAALPASVDAGLHKTIEGGISNLRSRALTLCTQPLPSSEDTATLSSTTSSSKSTNTTTTSTSTTTTETTSTVSPPTETPTATTPSGPGGGTQAPGTDGTGTPGAPGATPGAGTGQASPGTGAGTGENGQGAAGGAGQ